MVVYTNNLIIYTGANFEQTFVLEDDYGPFNLSGYTVISKFKKAEGSSTATSFTSTVANATNGIIRLQLTHIETSSLKVGRYLFDVFIYKDNVNTKVIEGEVIVKKAVTRY